MRNQTISTSIRNHSQQANAEVYASQDLLAGKVRIAEDKVTNDRHAAATNLLGKELNFTTNMLVTSLPFEQQLVGSFAGTLSSVRGLLNTQLNDDLVSYNAIYRQATTTDDGIFTAWTHRQTKQSVLSLVQQRDDVTNTPLGQINAPSRVPAIAMLNDGTHASDPTLVARRRELVNTFLAKRTN